jgi:hypothetical protein
VLGQRGHVPDRVGAGGVQAVQLDPVETHHHQLERAVGVRLDLGHLHAAADLEQPLRSVLADLVTLADADGAEDALGRVLEPQEVVDHGAVAVLEDPQRHAHPGEQHGVQGEHRERVAHGSSVAARQVGAVTARAGRTSQVAAVVTSASLDGRPRARAPLLESTT